MDQEESINLAVKTVEDIISFFEVNVEVTAFAEDDVINISVSSSDLNRLLIGRNAETLRSIQTLVIAALRSKDAAYTRVSLDIADYKKQRADQLAEKARGWIEQVRETGDSHITHLNAADRRVVHKVAQEYSDIRTFSEGEGRERHLIIAQASS